MTAPSDDRPALGPRIRAGRAALGLTQAALAAEVGCSAEMLRKFESGAKRPPAALLERLADRFALAGAERADFLRAGRAPVRPAAAPPAPPALWFPRTKLEPPRPRGDLLARPRLAGALHAAAPSVRLILVAAPAGSGKTTLLSEAVAGLARPSAWVTLDGDDNDPARLLAVLLAACAQLAPGLPALAPAIARALAGQQPDRTGPVRQAVALLVNGLMGLPAPALLVLDDLHTLVEPQIYAALEYLLAHLPAGLTMLVATRHDPPLGLARLRARRELLELRLTDLRFTPEEARDLLTERLGLALGPGELAALYERSEGWAAGLGLLAASLAGRGSADERARLLAPLAHGDHHLFDYLAEEVLDRQEPAARDFLLATAVLPELTAAGARAVTGRADAGAALDELCRRNLFLVRLGPELRQGGQDAYRYHDLFRGFLLERLRRDDPARLRELHRRAAAAAPDPQRAAEHLLQAELWEEAAERILAQAEGLLASGAHYTAQQLAEALPEELVARRPELRVVLGRCALQRWEAGTAAALLRGAAADLAGRGEMIGWAEALVFLTEALSRAGDQAAARATAEQALLLPLSAPRRVELLASRAWQSLVAGEGGQAVADVDAAITAAERSADPAAPPALAALCSGFLIGLPGGLARADRLGRLLAARGAPGPAALARAWAAIWRDDWDLAAAERGRALAALDVGGPLSAAHAELLLQGCLCAAAGGDEAAAEARCAELLAAVERPGGLGQAWRITVLHGLARACWLRGRHDELRAAHRRMLAALPEASWPTDGALCQEIGALARLAEGQAEAALAALRPVAEDQARQALSPVLGDPRWHLAHAYLRAGQAERARSTLGPALAALRREEAPGRLRWQGPRLAAELLRLRAGGGPSADFVAAALGRLEP